MAVFAFILIPFYLGVANSMMQSKAGASLRSIGLMTVAGVVAIAIWQAGQSVTAPSAALPIIIALCFLALVFLLGLGMLVGGQVARLQSKNTARNLALFATISFPALLSMLAAHQLESYWTAEESDRNAAREAFQKQTLNADFGDHSITFPVSPGLTIEHSCQNHSRVCVTRWNSEGINSAPANDLVLLSIQFSSMIGLEDEFMSWCENRSDLADTVWCELHHERDFSLRVEGQNHVPWEQAEGAELFEAPEQIKTLVCSDHWDGPFCRAIIDIAPGIEAHVPSQGLTPNAAGQRALEALPAINRYWEAMLKIE
jgi:hypothetical protein